MGDCNSSWLKVYDGGKVSGSLMGSYCGDEDPKLLLTTSNKVFIELRAREGDVIGMAWDAIESEFEYLNFWTLIGTMKIKYIICFNHIAKDAILSL